ncbi:MAG: hypothetical protein GY810_09185 [Aureispira sp.]|nr:hypothetical protein [Aureispira sp.]
MKVLMNTWALLCLVVSGVYAQAPKMQWLSKISGEAEVTEQIAAVTQDEYGNIYVTGKLDGVQSNYTGSTSLVVTDGEGQGARIDAARKERDFFLAKYSPNGRLEWMQCSNNREWASANQLICDKKGHIYIAGGYRGYEHSFDVDLSPNHTKYLPKYESAEGVFVATYDYDGKLKNAFGIGGNTGVTASDLALTPEGNLVVALTASMLRSGQWIDLNGDTRQNLKGADAGIVATYSPDGRYISSFLVSSDDTLVDLLVDVDGDGNIAVGGNYKGKLSLDNYKVHQSAGASGWCDDIFLASYTASGRLLWSKSFGGTSIDWISDLIVDAKDNIILSGFIRSRGVSFGPSTSLSSRGRSDVFIAKYSSKGTLQWAKREGGSYVDSGGALQLDEDDNIYMEALYSGRIQIGGKSLSTEEVAPAEEIMLVKYSADGQFEWVFQVVNDDTVYGISYYKGSLCIAGGFESRKTSVFYDKNRTALRTDDKHDCYLAFYGELKTTPKPRPNPNNNVNIRPNNNTTTTTKHQLLLNGEEQVSIQIKDEFGKVIYSTVLPLKGEHSLEVETK